QFYNKASSIIVLIFYYFYHGIRAACLEQALFSLLTHHYLALFSLLTHHYLRRQKNKLSTIAFPSSGLAVGATNLSFSANDNCHLHCHSALTPVPSSWRF
ncbi:unnamed protein product, partial [Musa acuminata subsp. burmannicoides]